MGMNTTRKPYLAELREHAVWIVPEQKGKYASQSAAISSVTGRVGRILRCIINFRNINGI